MARQVIDLTTPQPNGKFGEPTKAAWTKVNDMTLELYNGLVLSNGALQRSGGTMTGPLFKVGTPGQQNFVISNTGTQDGIGGTYASWAGRPSALLVSAQNQTLAYSLLKATNFGVKDLIGIDIYQGGSAPGSNTELDFHFSTGTSRHRFIDTGAMIIAGSLTQNSDYRIKDDILSIDPNEAASSLRIASPITYVDNRSPQDGRRSGWIAHNLQDAGISVVVKGVKDATKIESVLQGDTTPYFPGTEPEGYQPPVVVDIEVPDLQNVDYIGMGPFIHAGWIEHDNRIKELERRIEELTAIISKNGY